MTLRVQCLGSDINHMPIINSAGLAVIHESTANRGYDPKADLRLSILVRRFKICYHVRLKVQHNRRRTPVRSVRIFDRPRNACAEYIIHNIFGTCWKTRRHVGAKPFIELEHGALPLLDRGILA